MRNIVYQSPSLSHSNQGQQQQQHQHQHQHHNHHQHSHHNSLPATATSNSTSEQQVQFVENHQHQTPTSLLNHNHSLSSNSPKLIQIQRASSNFNSPSSILIKNQQQNSLNNSLNLTSYSNNSTSNSSHHKPVNLVGSYANSPCFLKQNNNEMRSEFLESPSFNNHNQSQKAHRTQHKLSSISSISSNSSISFLNTTSSSSNTHSDHYITCNSLNFDCENQSSKILDESGAHSPPNDSLLHNQQDQNITVRKNSPGENSEKQSQLRTNSTKLNLNSTLNSQNASGQSPICLNSSLNSNSSFSKSNFSNNNINNNNNNNSNLHDQNENERFFDSSTLYKKELKQKQREIILSNTSLNSSTSLAHNSSMNTTPKNVNTTPHSPIGFINQSHSFSNVSSSSSLAKNAHAQLQLQKLQQSILKHELEQQATQLVLSQPTASAKLSTSQAQKSSNSSPESDGSKTPSINKNDPKRSTLPTHSLYHNNKISNSAGSNKKVLNLFQNLLSRNKTNNSFNLKKTEENSSSSSKHLKRTISSTQFGKNKDSSNFVITPELNESSSNHNIKTVLFNPVSSLFSSKSSKYSIQSSDTKSTTSTSSNSSSSSSSSTRNNKYNRRSLDDVNHLVRLENCSCSSNSNKLETTAFLTNNNGLIFIPSPPKSAKPETIHEDEPQKNETIYENLENFKQDERKNSNQNNAFENEVYNYYDADNLRQNSKRLSDLNLLTSNTSPNKLSLNNKPSLIQHNASFSSTYSSSTSSSSSSSSSKSPVSFSNSTKTTTNADLIANKSSFLSAKSTSNSVETLNVNNSSVMSLKDKFEQLNKNKANSLPKKDLVLLINNATSSQVLSLNSPALSSISNSRSRSSSTCSSISLDLNNKTTTVYDRQAQEQMILSTPNKTIVEENVNAKTNQDSRQEQEADTEKENNSYFNFYYEVYRQKNLPNSLFNKSYTNVLCKFLSVSHNRHLKMFDFVFDPLVNGNNNNNNTNGGTDLLRSPTSQHYNILNNQYLTNESNNKEHCYKFTVDFFRPLYLNEKTKTAPANSKNVLVSILKDSTCINTETDSKLNGENVSAFLLSLKSENDLTEKLKEFDSEQKFDSDFNLNQLYEYLSTELVDLNKNVEDENDYVATKNKLKSFLEFKLNYFRQEMNALAIQIEENNRIGTKILKQLEDNLNVTLIELDKYKLLVNESEVITNLLLKLCNKLSILDNCVQFLIIKRLENTNSSNKSSEELELVMQEFNQVQRKKEEALFLKNGIDKRALIVSDFLLNYLDHEEHEEFETFLQMKTVYALQLRHLNDNIELTQLQAKLIDEL